MAFGISGDNPMVGNQPSITMALIELRSLTTLMQDQMGNMAQADTIDRLRNDEAVQLQVPTPLPGAGR